MTLNTHTLPWSPFDCRTYYWPRNSILITYWCQEYDIYLAITQFVIGEKKFVTCSKFQTSQDTVATCVIIFCCPKTGLGGDWRLSDRPRSPGGLILRVASITLKCHSGSSDHFCILTYLFKGTGQYWSLICAQWVISTSCNMLLWRRLSACCLPSER